ncbi:MAG: S-adenosylmethionine decarboxylase family protein [Planctomycetota bacterium]|jgi:S-adenosylmethionine/arginine decarboxylase-like enzyme
MDKTTTSGWHLMLDAIVREPGWISSPEKIREFLLGLIPRLGMELLDGPRITEVDLDPSMIESDLDEGGVTGYCLITTSHISIHTWPLRERFCLDVFSCRSFDPQIVLDYVREEFGVVSESHHWVERRWPDAPERTPLAVGAEAETGL